MIKRKQKEIIQSSLKSFPAVAIVGPRQVGKTTLAKTLSPIYFDLELEEEKIRLDFQWNEIINSSQPIILDEAQNFPEIFPRLRNAIDEHRKTNGRFLILGSVSPSLMKDVSEFLTGRIAICELLPISLSEMKKVSERDMWLMGGFPDGGILNRIQYPVWQKNYLDLLAMRDLPMWGLPAKPQTTQRFFKMLAISHGTLWNASQIGKSLGLSYHTVNTYLDYLEQIFLVRKVQPYFVNTKKRLVKSPKIYWRDSGLLHCLLNIASMDELLVQPWVGFSWEGWVIEQILNASIMNDVRFDGPYFFRTNDGFELDLVLVISGSVWAFEIKMTTNPSQSDFERLRTASAIIGAQKGILISHTKTLLQDDKIISGNLQSVMPLIIGE